MSYSRHINRKNERLGAKHKAEAEKSQLTYKVLSTLLAAGLVMSPAGVLAADTSKITPANGKDLTPVNHVFDIYAQTYNGKNTAINQFQDFQLGANEIANMYFHTEKDTMEAQNLLNFVDTRIDINGTLNAIRNKQIGGNLFFLSPGGMAVGKGGVINTGALDVMAPWMKVVWG